MAFDALQQKAISDYAVFAAHKNLAPLKLFSHTFTELDGRFGESIGVPVYNFSEASEFNADSNNYGSGVNEVSGIEIKLDQHLVKSVAITDKELVYSGIDWAKDTSSALAENLTRGVNKYVFGLINATNVAKSESFDATSKNIIANLVALAEENDIPVDRCIVALNPVQFSKVLGLLDYNTVGTSDYIMSGVVQNIFGFKGIVKTSNLPDGAKGAIILDEAMGIASKYLAPATADAYPEAYALRDESGFTMGARRFMDLAKGYDIFAMDCLFGAKLIQPDKVIRLV
jgi:hypothetical protein